MTAINPIDTGNAQSARNAWLIIASRFFSDFGTFLNMVALSTYVYALSQDVIQVSIFLACRVAGGLIASFIGVPFFRRVQGRRSLIAFDVLRASLLLLMLALPPEQQLYVLPALAMGIGMGNSMFAIGLNSQLPRWVDASRRGTTNAWLTSVSAMGAIAGSLVSGVALAASGYELVFVINIVIYVLARCFVLPLRFIAPLRALDPKRSNKEWRNLVSGLQTAPVLAGMLLVTIADTLGSAAHNVGFPVFSDLLTPENAGTTLGWLMAVWATGKFSGARMAGWLLRRTRDISMENLFFIGVALMSLGFIATFQQTLVTAALIFVGVAGIGDGLSDVFLVTRIQQEPEQLRLPVFSLMVFLQMTGFGIGMLIVAPFYLWFEPSRVIVIFHGLPLLTVATVALLARRWQQKLP